MLLYIFVVKEIIIIWTGVISTLIKILYKKQNVNYNFQKHLFMMLVHTGTCILQIN
jgi:predicted transglutaminase-like protease